MIQDVLGYCVKPEYLYKTWLANINNRKFTIQPVKDSLNEFERSIAMTEDSTGFEKLFSDIDLDNTALGSDLNARNKNLQALIQLFED